MTLTKVRLEEHRKAVVRGEIDQSNTADPIWKEIGNHLPLWKEFRITDRKGYWRIRRLKEAAYVGLIGFTLLYFKMAVMPIVPETKMADVGKLISLENLLVRKFTWFVLTTTSETLILSRDFGADCMTRVAYTYSRLSTTHPFPFRLIETTSSLTLQRAETTNFFHFDFQRQHTLSLTFDFQQSTPRNVLSMQLFSFLFDHYG